MGSAITTPVAVSPELRVMLIDQLLSKCKDVLSQNPNNRCCKFAIDYLNSESAKCLSNEDVQRFYCCIKTGIENPDSSLGCYASTANDYSDFRAFFDAVIRDYHGDTSGKKKHVTNWNSSDNHQYDLQEFGVENLSMRVRVGRNLEGVCLPASMTKKMRIEFEKKMIQVFGNLSTKYGGEYYSLSPDFGDNEPNPNLVSTEKYKSLVDNHVMFKDTSADSYLKSAGISSDWPYGRGCWQSEDKKKIIWVGEEDQLRIMSMDQGTDLCLVFTSLKEILDTIESIDGVKFASHEDYGYLTSCPSNLGTGMRASVHIKTPALTSDGTATMLKHLCEPLGLSARGTGSERTPIVDGTVEISPSSRLFISEGCIIGALYSGIKDILSIENKVSSNLDNLGAIVSAHLDESKCTSTENGVESDGQTIEEKREKPKQWKSDEKHDSTSIHCNEKRDDESVNFVLLENPVRDQVEMDEGVNDIRKLKEEMKAIKVSPSDRSMATQSPRSLKMSPSPILCITNA